MAQVGHIGMTLHKCGFIDDDAAVTRDGAGAGSYEIYGFHFQE